MAQVIFPLFGIKTVFLYGSKTLLKPAPLLVVTDTGTQGQVDARNIHI